MDTEFFCVFLGVFPTAKPSTFFHVFIWPFLIFSILFLPFTPSCLLHLLDPTSWQDTDRHTHPRAQDCITSLWMVNNSERLLAAEVIRSDVYTQTASAVTTIVQSTVQSQGDEGYVGKTRRSALLRRGGRVSIHSGVDAAGKKRLGKPHMSDVFPSDVCRGLFVCRAYRMILVLQRFRHQSVPLCPRRRQGPAALPRRSYLVGLYLVLLQTAEDAGIV